MATYIKKWLLGFRKKVWHIRVSKVWQFSDPLIRWQKLSHGSQFNPFVYLPTYLPYDLPSYITTFLTRPFILPTTMWRKAIHTTGVMWLASCDQKKKNADSDHSTASCDRKLKKKKNLLFICGCQLRSEKKTSWAEHFNASCVIGTQK